LVTLQMTANCEAALRRLRPKSAKEVLHIWVDALCIDQSSLAERSGQVAMIKEIYDSAERVVVWLGEGSPETDRAMRCLRRFWPLRRWSRLAKWTVNELYSHSKLSDVLRRMLRINGIPYSASNRPVVLPLRVVLVLILLLAVRRLPGD
jgi:hypothetical protein